MARIPRIMITGDPTAYHVISRTALDGYPIGDVEKDFFVTLLKQKARIYFADVLGYCIMGNHFHLLARMRPGNWNDNGYVIEETVGPEGLKVWRGGTAAQEYKKSDFFLRGGQEQTFVQRGAIGNPQPKLTNWPDL